MKLNFSPMKFTGYDATRLKSLYMQNVYMQETFDFMRELKKIAKKENFDVFVQNEEQMAFEVKQEDFDNEEHDIWAQDNKIIKITNGRARVLSPKLRLQDNSLPLTFALQKQYEIQATETVFEGGNLFVGKDEKQNPWLLLGVNTLYVSSVYQFLKDKGMVYITSTALKDFVHFKNTTQQKSSEVVWFFYWL